MADGRQMTQMLGEHLGLQPAGHNPRYRVPLAGTDMREHIVLVPIPRLFGPGPSALEPTLRILPNQGAELRMIHAKYEGEGVVSHPTSRVHVDVAALSVMGVLDGAIVPGNVAQTLAEAKHLVGVQVTRGVHTRPVRRIRIVKYAYDEPFRDGAHQWRVAMVLGARWRRFSPVPPVILPCMAGLEEGG